MSDQLPLRTDSLAATRSEALSTTISESEEIISDARRILEVGSPEDAQVALAHIIALAEELSSLLAAAHASQVELETTLTVTKSNLQLALANTEMLEEALKRDSGAKSKDIGWRRWSEREALRRREGSLDDDNIRPKSALPALQSRPQSPTPNSPTPSTSSSFPSKPSSATEDSGFFRFRFRSNNNSRPAADEPPNPPGTAPPSLSLTSASEPSLPPLGPSQREQELTEQLLEHKTKYETACNEKAALEAEVESLSQALFEEANKMVASERRRLAEAQEELRMALEERNAMKGTLRFVESENDRLKHELMLHSSTVAATDVHDSDSTHTIPAFSG